jgi:hypothetical protein
MESKGYAIELQRFLKIVSRETIKKIQKQNNINALTLPEINARRHKKTIGSSSIQNKSNISMQRHEGLKKKFMKIRRVYLQYSPKSFRF